MDYKTFMENAEVEFTLNVYVNGESVASFVTSTFESLAEQQHKMDNAVDTYLKDEFYSRAEYTAEQAEEYSR